MTEKWIQQMQQTKRLKLKPIEIFSHYFIVLLLLFISFLNLPRLYKIYFNNTYIGVRSGKELFYTGLLFLILAIMFYFIQNKRLHFREFKINQTPEEFKEAVKRTTIELEWNIEQCNAHFARTYRPWNWTGSWGEMITIIRDEDKILINSICNPNSISSISSYGWNKRNIKSFVSNLNQVKQVKL